ncbi:Pentatricopeptide repeat [Quillaja saponaria]|uniref:Pentatricopeptide repeat n=1 Tax=Quillaja saponaria TaxID=32244 RepID=A0AAD7LQA0_QUISA|nr:Pentatricopeptide repeat [Quillaja saponaria]
MASQVARHSLKRTILIGYRTISTTISNAGGLDFINCREKSITRSRPMEIVDALRMGERRRASDLLLEFGQGSQLLRANDFIDIFNYCARSPDPLFVMETWQVMQAREINLDSICSSLMMQALSKGGYLEEALNLINFLEDSQQSHPVLPLYNCFLRACAKMQSIVHANQCLDLMEHRMTGKNEVTYTELLKLAVWQKNLSSVHQIWKDYIKHYSISIIPLRKFIWSFTRLGDLKSAYEALQHMVSLAFGGNIVINKTAEGKLCSSRLDIPVPTNGEVGLTMMKLEGNDQLVPSIYCKKVDTNSFNKEQQIIFSLGNEEAESAKISMLNQRTLTPVMKVLRWSFSDVIHACAQSQNGGLAEQLVLQMLNLGLQPSSHTYDGFVRALVSERGFNEGMEVLREMRQKNLKPYDSTLATLSVSCSKAVELDLAEDLLNQISECPYAHPYNALLAACDTMNQPERAVRVLAKMKQLKVLPDVRTYELLFSLFGNVNAPYEEGNILSQVDAAKRIKIIELDMARHGVQHSQLSMKNLLKALGMEGMKRELIQYLHVAEKLFSHRNTYLGIPIYNIALHSLVEAKETDMAIKIFKNMKFCGCQPNAATYTIMIDCCSILRCFRSARALVSMMIRDGFEPETPAYTALLKILLEDENFDEALNLLDQASSQGIQLDVLLFNTVLQKASNKGRIDVIEFILESMHRAKIHPDPATCNYVFSAYVDCGFQTTAVEALHVLSMRMLCAEENTSQENKELEDEFVLAEDLDAESRILQFFKDSNENLAAALLNLRWISIAGFSISWSPDQSPWAKRLSTSYSIRRAAG